MVLTSEGSHCTAQWVSVVWSDPLPLSSRNKANSISSSRRIPSRVALVGTSHFQQVQYLPCSNFRFTENPQVTTVPSAQRTDRTFAKLLPNVCRLSSLGHPQRCDSVDQCDRFWHGCDRFLPARFRICHWTGRRIHDQLLAGRQMERKQDSTMPRQGIPWLCHLNSIAPFSCVLRASAPDQERLRHFCLECHLRRCRTIPVLPGIQLRHWQRD